MSDQDRAQRRGVDDARGGCNNHWFGSFECLGHDRPLQRVQRGHAIGAGNLAAGSTGAFLDLGIGIDERTVQCRGKRRADGCLADAHLPDQHDMATWICHVQRSSGLLKMMSCRSIWKPTLSYSR